MPLAIKSYQCTICGEVYTNEGTAVECEEMGDPIDVPIGTVFEVPDQAHVRDDCGIVRAVISQQIIGHSTYITCVTAADVADNEVPNSISSCDPLGPSIHKINRKTWKQINPKPNTPRLYRLLKRLMVTEKIAPIVNEQA